LELREIHYTDGLDETLDMMRRHGLLLTSVAPDGRPNAMTIGWGTVGVTWALPIFGVLVRPSRFTFGNIEAAGEFVVSVPGEDLRDACAFCGSRSGRDVDKFPELGLETVPAQTVSVPLIADCVRHYECKVVHRNDVIDAAIDPRIRENSYPNGDFHRIYHGQILRTVARG
jgi:flavin reductase (DIM6/NTAB) family NADH-FMN oxidoreductase RutF